MLLDKMGTPQQPLIEIMKMLGYKLVSVGGPNAECADPSYIPPAEEQF